MAFKTLKFDYIHLRVKYNIGNLSTILYYFSSMCVSLKSWENWENCEKAFTIFTAFWKCAFCLCFIWNESSLQTTDEWMMLTKKYPSSRKIVLPPSRHNSRFVLNLASVTLSPLPTISINSYRHLMKLVCQNMQEVLVGSGWGPHMTRWGLMIWHWLTV